MARKRNLPDNNESASRDRSKRLSLSPLTLEDALRGAMQTGKPPEPKPQNKHAKRAAPKRRLKGERQAVKANNADG